MAEKKIAHAVPELLAINTAPDNCKVGKQVIPFDITSKMSTAINPSSNVNAITVPVLKLDTKLATVSGDAGKGVKSGTSGGKVEILQASSTVYANGQQVPYHDSLCTMNDGNTVGKLCTAQSGGAKAQADAEGSGSGGSGSGVGGKGGAGGEAATKENTSPVDKVDGAKEKSTYDTNDEADRWREGDGSEKFASNLENKKAPTFDGEADADVKAKLVDKKWATDKTTIGDPNGLSASTYSEAGGSVEASLKDKKLDAKVYAGTASQVQYTKDGGKLGQDGNWGSYETSTRSAVALNGQLGVVADSSGFAAQGGGEAEAVLFQATGKYQTPSYDIFGTGITITGKVEGKGNLVGIGGSLHGQGYIRQGKAGVKVGAGLTALIGGKGAVELEIDATKFDHKSVDRFLDTHFPQDNNSHYNNNHFIQTYDDLQVPENYGNDMNATASFEQSLEWTNKPGRGD